MGTRAKWRNGVLTFFDDKTFETVRPLAPLAFYDDFLGTTLVAGATKWLATDVSALGAASQANVANAPNGTFRLHIVAQAEEEVSALTFNDLKFINLDKGPIVEYVAAAHVIPTILAEMYFGVGGDYVAGELAAADNGPLIHAMFMLDGSGAVTIHTDDGTTDNDAVATGVTLVLDVFHVFRIDFTVLTDVKFYIDGVAVATGTTFDMSAGANVMVQPYMAVYKSAGAGLGDFDVDAIRVWGGR
jgi:hypothetical protein